MFFQGALIVLLLVNCVSLSSQGCGSTSCSQDYDSTCPHDESCDIYDSCKTSQSGCNTDMEPTDTLKVDCYDTCIEGSPGDPSIPLRCCADPIGSSDAMSLTVGQGYLIARLYSPNEAGLGVYRHNTFCKYNVQCPSEAYDLHYLMVRFNVEQPTTNGKCLDFLRYHFTATGANVDNDACGDLPNLPAVQKSGAHGSSLTLDFRSNRIERSIDFFLAITCVSTGGARKKRSPSDCLPSLSLNKDIVRNLATEDYSDDSYLVKAFPKLIQRYARYPSATVTCIRKDVVMYKNNAICIKREGRTIRRFRNIKVFYLYNSIEGHVKFRRNSSPRGRTFPGYGILRVLRGTALYYQTIIDPRHLLNDKEVSIVRDIYQELLNRHVLDNERFYFTPPDKTLDDGLYKVNCSINELAEINTRSCTDVVRAAANFFLQQDTYKDICYRKK